MAVGGARRARFAVNGASKSTASPNSAARKMAVEGLALRLTLSFAVSSTQGRIGLRALHRRKKRERRGRWRWTRKITSVASTRASIQILHPEGQRVRGNPCTPRMQIDGCQTKACGRRSSAVVIAAPSMHSCRTIRSRLRAEGLVERYLPLGGQPARAA